MTKQGEIMIELAEVMGWACGNLTASYMFGHISTVRVKEILDKIARLQIECAATSVSE